MNIKRIAVGIVILVLLVVGFIIADYFALFGTKTEIKLDFVEARFRTLDAETGGLIMDVGVRCVQKGSDNACTRRDSHRAGIVSVHIPTRRVVIKTLFFTVSDEYIKPSDPNLHVWFIHNDYHKVTESILLEDVYTNAVSEYVTKMKRHVWEATENDE